MYCKDCKFGDSNDAQTHNGLIECLYAIDYNKVPSFETGKPVEDQTKAYPFDYEGYMAGLYVGRMFGCINFKEK